MTVLWVIFGIVSAALVVLLVEAAFAVGRSPASMRARFSDPGGSSAAYVVALGFAVLTLLVCGFYALLWWIPHIDESNSARATAAVLVASIVGVALMSRERYPDWVQGVTKPPPGAGTTPPARSAKGVDVEALGLASDVCYILECIAQECSSDAKREAERLATKLANSASWSAYGQHATNARLALNDWGTKRASYELGKIAKPVWLHLGAKY